MSYPLKQHIKAVERMRENRTVWSDFPWVAQHEPYAIWARRTGPSGIEPMNLFRFTNLLKDSYGASVSRMLDMENVLMRPLEPLL